MFIPLKLIGAVLAIICAMLGVWLICLPRIFASANRLSKVWFATKTWEEKLNRTRDVDRQLMKIRRVLGFILLFLALFFSVLLLQ
ncbi:MAG: hypothetical protein GX806_03555 [Lentisphaerae bacterium]|nr:hypothetical protein [Lentisphaerota bacterium]